MKIGILTASRTNNIGTDMQALAMQWLFQSYANTSVELINYKCNKLENSRKIFYPKNLHGLLSIPYKLAQRSNHSKFRMKYFNYSKQIYDSSNISLIDYDLTVVGSDQIWNFNITGNDLSFYLPFDTRGMKSSYAASISEENIKLLAEKHNLHTHLAAFQGVSVREKQAADVLSEIGIEARSDLDPLLMIDAEKWNSIASNNHPSKGYVLLYVVDRVQEAVSFAKKYAKEHNLDVYMWGNVIKPVKGVKPIRFSGMEDWLSFMKHADLVVTNSYHGLSFAINYQKKFAIFNLKSSDSNLRLDNLLNLIGLENKGDGHIYNPDWTDVFLRINVQRVDSRAYIARMLERAENNAT